MMHWVVSFDFCVDEDCDGISSYPSDFVGKCDKYFKNVLKRIPESKIFILHIKDKKFNTQFSRQDTISKYKNKSILRENEDLRELFALIQIDLRESSKNKSYVWDELRDASEGVTSVSAFGPTDEISTESDNRAQQSFSDGEYETGFFTLDDQDECIVDMTEMPEEIAVAFSMRYD